GRAMRPRFRSAIADLTAYANGRSKSLDASGGGDGPRPRETPPPRHAIGLSSPVGGLVGRINWRAKPVAFRPPPPRAPKASLRHRGRDENGRAKFPRTPPRLPESE